MSVILSHILVIIFALTYNSTHTSSKHVTQEKPLTYLVVFFDPGCHFCMMELPEVLLLTATDTTIHPVLIVRNNPLSISMTDSLSRLTGIPYLIDDGQWETADVKYTPTIGLYYENTGRMYIISEGFLPADSLKSRIETVKKSLSIFSVGR